MTDRQSLNRKTISEEIVYPERIVQFGAGNFIRAFADWMINILNAQTDFASSVVVVKVTPDSTYDALDAQDGLFHVHTEGIQNGDLVSKTELIKCISRTVYPYLDYDNYLALARQAEIRFLISNTTEAGISYDANDDLDDTPPASFPAKLTHFLYARYQHFDGDMTKGCIILPTELVVDNGSQLREMVMRYSEQWQLDNAFTDWVVQHNIFCNTLVDRIVPGYPHSMADEILDTIGYDDALLVMGEPYHSFVIAAPDSVQEEVPFHQTNINVKFVDDVDRYRQIKIRILNGLHTSMVTVGLLLGLETVREAVEHPVLGQYLRDEAYQDIIPSMNIDSNELEQFAEDVFDRFLNPAVHHKLLDIAMNTSTKVRTRIIPTILAYQDKYNKLPLHAVFALAAFIRLYKGQWDGESIALNDDKNILQWFSQQWDNCLSIDELVTSVLEREELWQVDLSQIKGLHAQLCSDLTDIEQGKLSVRIEALNG